jgi:hypothetical protein
MRTVTHTDTPRETAPRREPDARLIERSLRQPDRFADAAGAALKISRRAARR